MASALALPVLQATSCDVTMVFISMMIIDNFHLLLGYLVRSTNVEDVMQFSQL